MFGNKHRYLNVAVSRDFSAGLAGGLAGALGAALIAKFDGPRLPLKIYTFVLAAITFATPIVATETKARDLTCIPDALDEVRSNRVAAR